jgi:hypothetical protein
VTRRALLAVVLLATTVGCGESKKQAVTKETSHLRMLTNLYARSMREVGRPPANEQEFKDAIAKMGVSLEALKVGSIDELFVSERDGQPFVVLYGPQKPGSDVVAYEQTGVDGIRWVGFTLGNVEECDAARFAELVPSGGAAAK